jgi:hypothetical protein
MQLEAIEAVRAGRPEVHISWRGRVMAATEVVQLGSALYVRTRHFNGERGMTVPASECVALERTYEEERDA